MPLVQFSVIVFVVCVITRGPSTGLTTAMVNEHEFVLPHASLATHKTVLVVLAWNAVPDGGDEVTVTLLQVSVAVTDQVTMMLLVQVVTTMFVGQTMLGGLVSTTVTVWLQMETLLQTSIACHVRVINCGQLPFVIVPTTVMVTFVPEQVSKAVGASKVHAVPHCTILLVAQVSDGGVISTTVTICVQVTDCPRQSLTVQMAVTICGQMPLVTTLVKITVGAAGQHGSGPTNGGSNTHGDPH
jgi:hypothetical protein